MLFLFQIQTESKMAEEVAVKVAVRVRPFISFTAALFSLNSYINYLYNYINYL